MNKNIGFIKEKNRIIIFYNSEGLIPSKLKNEKEKIKFLDKKYLIYYDSVLNRPYIPENILDDIKYILNHTGIFFISLLDDDKKTNYYLEYLYF